MSRLVGESLKVGQSLLSSVDGWTWQERTDMRKRKICKMVSLMQGGPGISALSPTHYLLLAGRQLPETLPMVNRVTEKIPDYKIREKLDEVGVMLPGMFRFRWVLMETLTPFVCLCMFSSLIFQRLSHIYQTEVVYQACIGKHRVAERHWCQSSWTYKARSRYAVYTFLSSSDFHLRRTQR